MGSILNALSLALEQLLGRASGPLHFRLFVMPIVVTILAIRAGLRDARGGQSSFWAGVVTSPIDRRRHLLSALRDVGKVFAVAVVLDTIYQCLELPVFSVMQLLFVATACAIVPYVLIRGPVTVLARRRFRK